MLKKTVTEKSKIINMWKFKIKKYFSMSVVSFMFYMEPWIKKEIWPPQLICILSIVMDFSGTRITTLFQTTRKIRTTVRPKSRKTWRVNDQVISLCTISQQYAHFYKHKNELMIWTAARVDAEWECSIKHCKNYFNCATSICIFWNVSLNINIQWYYEEIFRIWVIRSLNVVSQILPLNFLETVLHYYSSIYFQIFKYFHSLMI
jgi:hypothetical protein